jgi:hypothetical protein
MDGGLSQGRVSSCLAGATSVLTSMSCICGNQREVPVATPGSRERGCSGRGTSGQPEARPDLRSAPAACGNITRLGPGKAPSQAPPTSRRLGMHGERLGGRLSTPGPQSNPRSNHRLQRDSGLQRRRWQRASAIAPAFSLKALGLRVGAAALRRLRESGHQARRL